MLGWDRQFLKLMVGKIDVFDNQSYVAIDRSLVDQALAVLTNGKMKGRFFKARKLL